MGQLSGSGRAQRHPRRGAGGRHRADDAAARHGGAARPDRGARHRDRRRARLRGPLRGPPRRAVAAQRPGDRERGRPRGSRHSGCRRPPSRPAAPDDFATYGQVLPILMMFVGTGDRPGCRHADAARRRVPAARRQRPRGGTGTPRRLARRRRDPPAEPRRGTTGDRAGTRVGRWGRLGFARGRPRDVPPADRARSPSRRASTGSATRSGRVIYVGKAKSLRQRLTSYFADLAGLHPRTADDGHHRGVASSGRWSRPRSRRCSWSTPGSRSSTRGSTSSTATTSATRTSP